jgi:hypothetical protein
MVGASLQVDGSGHENLDTLMHALLPKKHVPTAIRKGEPTFDGWAMGDPMSLVWSSSCW